MSDVTNFTVDGTVINVKDENAVSILANQGLTEQQKSNARSNIGAGDSSFSGSYNDLTDKPTIPVVNNATLTIQKNGTTVESFTANASSNVTANITVPTKVSQLTNDSGYTTNTGTVTQVKVGSTAYNPSSGVVSLPAYPSVPTVNNGTLTIQKNGTNVQTFTANQSSNATANITVPTKVSELTNDSGYTTNTGTVTQVKVGTTAYNPSSGVISLPAYPTVNNATLTIQRNGTNVQTFTANQGSNATANISVPTKVSQLTNDSGYTTNTGTVTQVKVGTTAYNPNSGVVSLPAYPTVNNATLTIQRNGTNVQTFTANQGSNATANITVPNWYHFQNKVTSTAINFPTGWKRAIVVLRDNATGYAGTFTLSYEILNAVGNTTFVSGYFYTSADYMSIALICNSGGVIGKSITKNGAVRAATDTTISVMISTI